MHRSILSQGTARGYWPLFGLTIHPAGTKETVRLEIGSDRCDASENPWRIRQALGHNSKSSLTQVIIDSLKDKEIFNWENI